MEGDKSSWMFDTPWNVESTLNPLLNLFKHLKIKPYQKVAFTPEELNAGKRVLHIEDGYGEVAAALPNEIKKASSKMGLSPCMHGMHVYKKEKSQ